MVDGGRIERSRLASLRAAADRLVATRRYDVAGAIGVANQQRGSSATVRSVIEQMRERAQNAAQRMRRARLRNHHGVFWLVGADVVLHE